MITVVEKIKLNVPGILIVAVLAVPCWLAGQAVPVVGGPVFGILVGMIIALFWKQEKRPHWMGVGVQFASKKILQLAVIMLGFGLNLLQIAQVGASSLPVILSTIATSLIIAFILCKALKIPSRIATLVGVGSSICGGSAIAATAPVIKANDEEVAQAISVVFLFNVIAALIFPTLGGFLGMSNEGFGLFAGTAINDTSSVTAAAAAWDGMHPGSNALDYATIVKLTRTLAIIPITLILALWGVHKTKKQAAQTKGGLGSFSLKRAFPMFILWFLAAAAFTTICAAAGVDVALFAPAKTISKYFIIMEMIAIGLNTNIVKLVRSGAKPILLGCCCWIGIACMSLFVQYLLGIW